jgi:hypothetical protein
MRATSACNAFLVQNRASLAYEVKGQADPIVAWVDKQEPKPPGPTPPYRDRFPEWALRIATREHISDILRAELPELDDATRDKVRKSYEHWWRTYGEDRAT